jgi:serine/threonine protein kinase
VNAPFDVIGQIASGGMAEVYLARARIPGMGGKEVVLKRLLPELQNDEDHRAMFEDEIRIALKLQHPNIVVALQSGELDGARYLAMEWIQGASLAELADANRGALPAPLVLRIAIEALSGLEYAHDLTDDNGQPLGIVHRDVSPDNILVTFDGSVKLIDFGVAKAFGERHKTRAGVLQGKFAYMAPEQVREHAVDKRADLFSLGVVLYEMIFGTHPFEGQSSAETLGAILRDPPPRPPAGPFPRQLVGAIFRALNKAPGDRYPSARSMREELERLGFEHGLSASQRDLKNFVGTKFADRQFKAQSAQLAAEETALIRAIAVPSLDRPRRAEEEAHRMAGVPSTETRQEFGKAIEAIFRATEGPDEAGAVTLKPTKAPTSYKPVESEYAPILAPSLRGGTGSVTQPRTSVNKAPFLAVAAVAVLAGVAMASLVSLVSQDSNGLRLVITTEPEGAHIVIDGTPLGLHTPQVLENLRYDQTHDIELHMDGFVHYRQRVEPTQSARELEIDWHFPVVQEIPGGVANSDRLSPVRGPASAR